MPRGQRSGEHGRDPAGSVDGDIERQVGRRQRGGDPHEVVHGVAGPGHEGGPAVGDTARMVSLQNGRVGGESGTDRFGPATEAGEEVRLDEAGDDAQVGLDVLALE